VPPAVVLATDVFDQFVTENNLLDFACIAEDDAEIQRKFLDAPLSTALAEDLKSFLAEVTHPLAGRSSSLLEIRNTSLSPECMRPSCSATSKQIQKTG